MIFKRIALMAVLFSMFGFGMAFAALSQQLDIYGTASVEIAGWDISFSNLQSAVITGTAQEEIAPVLNARSTTITGFDINLHMTNDTVTYVFDVVNNGTINASLGTLTYVDPICEGLGADKVADENLVCGNLDYSLTYVGGLEDGQAVSATDTLDAGMTKTMALTLSYEGLTTPINAVEITDLGVVFIYVQN